MDVAWQLDADEEPHNRSSHVMRDPSHSFGTGSGSRARSPRSEGSRRPPPPPFKASSLLPRPTGRVWTTASSMLTLPRIWAADRGEKCSAPLPTDRNSSRSHVARIRPRLACARDSNMCPSSCAIAAPRACRCRSQTAAPTAARAARKRRARAPSARRRPVGARPAPARGSRSVRGSPRPSGFTTRTSASSVVDGIQGDLHANQRNSPRGFRGGTAGAVGRHEAVVVECNRCAGPR